MELYDRSRTPEVLGGTITVVVLALISVGGRIAGRRVSAAGFWWDDWVIMIAMILDLALCIGYWLLVSKGRLGRHTEKYGGPVTEENLDSFYKILLAIQLMYFSTAVAIKTSLILLYYRIFRVIRWFRWLLTVAWTICFFYFIVDFFVAIFECKPVAYYWNKTLQGGTCINENQFYRWNGVANLLIDFMIWSLTLPVIWHLKLSVRQRISLSAVFLLGLLACAASIVRVTSFDEVNLADITWTLVDVATWTTVEQSVGIICACLPTMKPLLGYLLSNVKHRSNRNDPETGNHSDSLPLSDYDGRKADGDASLLASKSGFHRLDEETQSDFNVVTANATKVPSDQVPTVPRGILMQHSFEQRSDRADRC